MLRKVLIIAYFFPPLGGGGVLRPLKFSKYLPKSGWVPIVITVAHSRYAVRDSSLLKELDPLVRVCRVASLEPTAYLRGIRGLSRPSRILETWMLVPDAKIGWVPFVVREALRITKTDDISAVISTSSPASAHLAALWIKRATGLPWVADFRDEWTQNPFIHFPTRLHRWIHEKLESTVLLNADAVISVSEPITEGLAELVDPSESDKFITITNGFDKADLFGTRGESMVERRPYLPQSGSGHEQNSQKTDRRFRITYVGSFYGIRSSSPFLSAAAELCNSGALPARELEITFVGSHVEIPPDIPEGIVRQTGYVAHRIAIEEMLSADALLLVIPNGSAKNAYTGKLFEYLGTGRAILALAPPEGVAAKLIKKAKAGVIADPDEHCEIKNAIMKLYRAWEAGKPLTRIRQSVVMQYDRERLTQRLAQLLDHVVDRCKAGSKSQ